MIARIRLGCLALCALLLTAAGCSPTSTAAHDGPSATVAGSTRGMTAAARGMPSSTDGAASTGAGSADPHNQADITFASMMLVHHRGAIAMADLAPSRSASPAVRTLALQIKAAQQPEIAEMTKWIGAWSGMDGMTSGQMSVTTASGDMGAMAGAMPGMMTGAQMSRLTVATGPVFDTMFLQLMIVHHRGALTMATTEEKAGRNPAALMLARSIISSQTAQITQMRAMLTSK